jgi:hypothetical protein
VINHVLHPRIVGVVGGWLSVFASIKARQ